MHKKVEFQIEGIETNGLPAWVNKYPEEKFTIAKCCFLSTKKNSHRLEISEKVLRDSAESILGNFLVAKMEYGDATTHRDDEQIFGYFPIEQKIEFVKDGDITKAYAYCVLSKQYSKEFNKIFTNNNFRNTSVEMMVELADGDENNVLKFDIFGLTCLGEWVKPSCPDAEMQIVRFSKDEAEQYFKSIWDDEIVRKEEICVVEDEVKLAEEEEKVEGEQETKEEELCDVEVEHDVVMEEKIDYETKCAELTAQIEERDNIIMEKDEEIKKLQAANEELTRFKATVEFEKKTAEVNALLAEVKEYLDDGKLVEMQKQGIESENLDAWKNSVKAVAFEATKNVKKLQKQDEDVMRLAAPIETIKKPIGLWD